MHYNPKEILQVANDWWALEDSTRFGVNIILAATIFVSIFGPFVLFESATMICLAVILGILINSMPKPHHRKVSCNPDCELCRERNPQ